MSDTEGRASGRFAMAEGQQDVLSFWDGGHIRLRVQASNVLPARSSEARLSVVLHAEDDETAGAHQLTLSEALDSRDPHRR